jgi:hypothetical protein
MPAGTAEKNRLTSIPDGRDFAPWFKAQTSEVTLLYSLPVGSFSTTQERRFWLGASWKNGLRYWFPSKGCRLSGTAITTTLLDDASAMPLGQ